ncbi:glycosyltransferase [Nocardia sp. alder85J]|uniref:glycosyltransferase n=1 Tax=Nocardia sp. alder85J TaxID=2862949 RepID=UPI001CD59D69|nr:glycosyltransferase [Nocardia sp. alder85J]MCX4093087.1 glycosyltransferase [Nocardia sp. alder85J]
MRFHVAALPYTQTTKYYTPCAYTQKVRKFCDMMMGLGHEVYLYAGEENEAACTELITVFTKDEQRAWFGEKTLADGFDWFSWNPGEMHWIHTNSRVITEIAKRKQPRDFLCVIGGSGQKPLADAFPELQTVEYGVGYSGVFAKYRVFESYAWMHAVHGARTTVPKIMSDRGQFYDAVIPNYFEVADFPFSAEKDDYFLFVGRIIEAKGVQIAVDACRRLGARLILAGAGRPPSYGEHVGMVDVQRRGELMSRARGVFVPSLYLEPFGGVHVEAMLCGTPVITTDWGAFSETVQQGVQGFRCRTLREFTEAGESVDKLDHQGIRDYAVSKFSTEAIAPQYDYYFRRLETLWDDGFYTM